VQGAGYLKQSDSTKYFLFAMSTVIPFLTGSLGIVPKLFYDLAGKKRDDMYLDLFERRAQVSKDVSGGDGEGLARATETQNNVNN